MLENTATNHIVQESIDNLILEKSNEIQIRLCERFGIDIKEFTNYYSENFRRLFDKLINSDFPEKTDWLVLENKIFYYLRQHYCLGKTKNEVQDILDLVK